jgi:hypothetical protein
MAPLQRASYELRTTVVLRLYAVRLFAAAIGTHIDRDRVPILVLVLLSFIGMVFPRKSGQG